MTPRIRIAVLPLLSLSLIACGCHAVIKYPRGLLEQQEGKTNLSSRELRVLVNDLVVQYASRVEHAADQIMVVHSDPAIRKNAILWKTNGISACFQAASRRDPLSAYMDIWVLNKQSLALFEQPSDPPLFGTSQEIAIKASQELESSLQEILTMIGPDFPVREDFPIAFARDYPIRDLYFNRESIAAHYTDYIAKVHSSDREITEVVGDIDDQLDQLQRLSSIYAEFVPKQARWHGELVVLETLRSEEVMQPLQDMTVAADAVARIADTTQDTPALVERERELLYRTISAERMATLNDVNRMRVETLDKLEQERTAVMADLKSERTEVMEAMREERIAATGDLTRFGEESIRQLDASVDQKMTDVANLSVELADHVFRRVVQLSLGVGGFILFSLILILRNRQPRPQPSKTWGNNDAPMSGPNDASPNDTSVKPSVRYLDEHRRKAA